MIVAYEWFKLAAGGALPFAMPQKSQPAPRQQLLAFFANLERELEKVEFFRPPDKRETMQINLRNIFSRMQPTRQDIQTLHGVIMAIAEGRKGPARGGVLDGEEAGALRALLAEHGQGRVPGERGPVRGLRACCGAIRPMPSARCGRRSPGTAASPACSSAQTPVGPHINDFVSFPLRAGDRRRAGGRERGGRARRAPSGTPG